MRVKRALRLVGFFFCCLIVAILIVIFYGPYYTGLAKSERYFYSYGFRCSCGGAEFAVIENGQQYDFNPHHGDLRWSGYLQKEGDTTYLLFPAKGHLYRVGIFDPQTHEYRMLGIKDPSQPAIPVPFAAPWQVLAEFYWVHLVNRILGYD